MNGLFTDLLTALLNKHMNLCVLLTLEEEHELRMFLLFLLLIPLIQVSSFFLLYFLVQITLVQVCFDFIFCRPKIPKKISR